MATDELSITFAALADPTRRAILERLSKGEATVMELAQPFELSLPGVSKHLKVLRRAGASKVWVATVSRAQPEMVAAWDAPETFAGWDAG